MVSHDTHSIVNLCDRVLLLENGHILFDGDPVEGVAEYTKILHDEHFSGGKKKEERAKTALSAHPAQEAILPEDFSQWIKVPQEKRSGVEEVLIEYLSVVCDGKPVNVVQQGDVITIRLLVHATTALDDLIFGYTVKDRIGNAVFGENSLCLDIPAPRLEAGRSIVEYSFCWPEVYPYKYTITVGIGQGEAALGHVVQCWAHDIVSLTAITPNRSIHGMFNNDLESLTVQTVELAAE